MTESRLQQLNKKDLVIERDHTFGIEQSDSGNDIQELVGERLVDVEIKLLLVLQSNYHLRWAIALIIVAPKSNTDHFHYAAQPLGILQNPNRESRTRGSSGSTANSTF